MSSIHSQRAKRWGTNPFIAEWLANAFQYCHNTAEGKQAFETWAVRKYGATQGRITILSCHNPPRKKYGIPTGNAAALLWNASAVELGISDEAMHQYHLYTAENNLCSPERTKPAPKRRRGETSPEWLARRHQALLEGCKLPNIDWEVCRAIAISEADKVRDTIEVWRTRPDIFLDSIARRGASTIPSPEILDRSEEYKMFHTMDDAFRTTTYGLGIAHMAWSDAALVFEDLARMGLTTASAIERRYKKDTKLLWRLVACFVKSGVHLCHLWYKLSHIISWCEHFRPYFKRWRSQQGVAKVEKDMAYINKHGFKGSLLDEIVVATMTNVEGISQSFFNNLTTFLKGDPSQASKFSQEAYDALGDIAIVQEFHSQVFDSPFGQRLREYARSFDALGPNKPDFLPQVSFMDPSKIRTPGQYLTPHWGDASRIIHSCDATWSKVTWSLSIMDTFPQIIGDPLNFPHVFDAMWKKADLIMWEAAKQLDNPGEHGRVANVFGLINPHDRNRPTFTEYFFRSLEPSRGRIKASSTPAPAPCPYVEAIAAATPSESAAKSGHAYVNAASESRPKSKKKTKGAATLDTAPIEEPDPIAEVEPEGLEGLPFALPTHFKLGKRLLKVFHRILEDDQDTTTENAPKKGQLRWGDFERAMRRVGFEIVQTAGSSVRFDPPAQTARPITFHRPHPDSLLSPHMIKWVGARLKRTYGWTTASFAQGAEAE